MVMVTEMVINGGGGGGDGDGVVEAFIDLSLSN